jgi:myo-inositol-1(or 4)-monophosphatase
MDSQQLTEIYAFAVQLGKDAGDMLMAAAQRRIDGRGTSSTTVSYVEKENSVDLVTKTDNDVENFIRTTVASKYPDHG